MLTDLKQKPSKIIWHSKARYQLVESSSEYRDSMNIWLNKINSALIHKDTTERGESSSMHGATVHKQIMHSINVFDTAMMDTVQNHHANPVINFGVEGGVIQSPHYQCSHWRSSAVVVLISWLVRKMMRLLLSLRRNSWEIITLTLWLLKNKNNGTRLEMQSHRMGKTPLSLRTHDCDRIMINLAD